MKTKLRKFGAWLMAAALAFAGAGAVQAAEVHVSDAAGLKTVFANATADTTIVLDADITTKDHLSCEKDCVLDLAGHKIVGDYSGGDMFASGTLINVKGTTSFKLISSVSGGGMSVEGVKSFTGKYNGLAVNLSSAATVTFGEEDGSKADFTLYGAYQGMNVSGTVIFNGGSFECGTDGVAVQLQSGCNVIMNGGSISSIKGLDSATVTVGAGKALACLTSGGKPQLCDIPSEGLDLSYGQIIIGLANGGNYLVKQSDKTKSANTLTICADAGVAGTVAIDGLVIDQSDAIVCKSGEGATINLELDGETKLGLAASATYGGGVRNPGDGLLVIQDENDVPGSLTAVGKSGAAAIGGASSPHSAVANITIKGGTIVATAVHGAAIGSGNEGAASNIKILGGTVTVTSEYGAGIGGGNKAHAESIIISGGTVVASSARGQAVGSGFECGDDNAGISIFCGTYSPAPTADMIAAGYEVIEKDGEFIIGVKTEDDVVITTGTQETKVEVSTDVVKDQEAAQKIAQGTKVEGVNLTADTEQKKGGIQTVLETAKTQDPEFAAAVETAAEVSVKVEVDVEPTEFENTQDKGKVAFKLTPKAVVSVGEGEGKKERIVPVSNDMIDQNQKIAVSIYTGFKPVVITHDDENGSRIETFEGDQQIAYNEATGFATVLINHFSTLSGFEDASEVPDAKVYVAKVGDTFYETLADAFAAVPEKGTTVVLLKNVTGFKLPSKDMTITASDPTISIMLGEGDLGGSGAKVLFKDLTVIATSTSQYTGFKNLAVESYENCTIQGQLTGWGEEINFTGCHFKQTTNNYCPFLYNGTRAVFIGCDFDVAGKAIKIGKDEDTPVTVIVSNCQFKTSVAKKPAVMLDVSKHKIDLIVYEDTCTLNETYYAKNDDGSYKVEGGYPFYFCENHVYNANNNKPDGFTEEMYIAERAAAGETVEHRGEAAVGTDIVLDPETGKVAGGTFSKVTDAIIAEGFVPEVDSETGKIGVVPDPITGSGTEADPYVISDLKGLQAFRDRVNAGNTYQGKFVKLGADIDLASVENWEPIGDFLGTFDGLGNTIDNLTGEHGLFTGLSAHPDKPGATSALIKNFTLDHVRMVSTGNDVGAVAGTSAPGVTIENVHVKNGYVSGRQYVGGIVGHWYATITDCSYEGEVYGMQAGGIAGSGGFVISNCKFVGMVEGDTWVGGICGQFQDGSQMVKDCYVEGTVSADYDFYGAGAAGIVSVPCNLNAEISGNYCNMVAEIGGEAVECPIIGAYNADAEGATFPNLKNNSWNMEKYTITEISVTETGVDEVRAVKPRNANLVGSVKDLEYVGGGVVEIAAGSAIADKTPEEIAAQITNPDLTVKIEDGKIVAYPHVAKVGDTSYLTLDEALQHATDGTTLTLLEDVADIGAATLNGITFDGNGHKIIGASALYCGAEKTTAIKNVVFENIHNAEGSQSAIYGEGFSTGSISITGCTFDTCDWDAIQIVPADGATGKIVIVDNVFKHTDETKSQLRYIHIQHMTTTDVHPVQLDTTITDNRFFDTGKSAGAEKICSILFASVGGTLKVDGNYYDDASTIYTDSIPLRNFYPMRSQPDVDVDDVLFPLFSIDAETYTTLADAVAAANGKSGYPTIRLNGDLVVDETVEINNVNGSLVTFNAAGFDIQANVAMFNIKTKAAFYGDNGYPAQPGLVTCPSEDKVFNVDNGVSLVIQNAVFSKDVSYLVANPHKDVCVLTDDGNYKIVSLTDEQALAKGYVVRNKTSEQDAEYYASIAELISEKYASKGGGTIGLIADVSEDIAVSGKYLAMYAGDYTYTGSVMLDDNKYFGAYSGTVHLTNVNCGPLYAYGGTLVVDNGKAASFGCGSPSDISIRNGIYGSDPTAYVDPEISDVVERATDPVTWEVIEKTSIAAVVSADGTQTEYKKLSKALEAAQPGEKVILLANTDEANVPLKPDQEIVLNGHAFTGTVDQTNVPEGYDAMVTTPDGRVFSAPAKVEVPIGESSVIKVRMLDTAENLATPQANGRPLWANKALGIESDFKIKPVVERPAAGSKTITIKSNIPDSVLEAAAQQRDGVSVKFQLAKKVGSVGTYVQFGEKKVKPEFAVEADEQEVQTFWKIQVFFEEEY